MSLEDLQRLGLSERQAQSIDNYRSKGGRFRTKADFKKMYVVSDSLYERLEPFIDIPKVELNSADTTALMTLRGIGPYYAGKIIECRGRLGGYYEVDQLLEIYRMDEERLGPIREGIRVDTSVVRRINIWSLPEDSLVLHPYIGRNLARGIVRYRRVCDSAQWTAGDLLAGNVIDSAVFSSLRHYMK